jgi:tetratricopeptide (TPR) repeat protein
MQEDQEQEWTLWTKDYALRKTQSADLSERAKAHFRLGQLDLESFKLECALTNFVKASECNFNKAQAHLRIAEVLYKLNRTAEALEQIRVSSETTSEANMHVLFVLTGKCYDK